MNPYRITQATLTTYSGKKVTVKLETDVFSKPLRVVKEILLDGFVKMFKSSPDPFVKIECKTKPLFHHDKKRRKNRSCQEKIWRKHT